MSKKTVYEIPEIEIIALKSVDIITTSPQESEWDDDNVRDDGWV